MAIDPATFSIILQCARSAVAGLLDSARDDIRELSRSSDKTICKVMKCFETSQHVRDEEPHAWERAIFHITLEQIESVAMLLLLENDMTILAMYTAKFKWAGPSSFDPFWQAWQAVVEDVRQIVDRTAFYLRRHHIPGPEEDQLALENLLSDDLTLPTRTKASNILSYFDQLSSCGAKHTTHIHEHLLPLRATESIIDILETMSPFPLDHAPEPNCYSSICNYRRYGQAGFKPSDLNKLLKAWRDWMEGKTRDGAVWRITWTTAFKVAEGGWKHNVPPWIIFQLRMLLGTRAFISPQPETPAHKRRSRNEVLAILKARKSDGIVPSFSPKATSKQDARRSLTSPPTAFQAQSWLAPDSVNDSQWTSQAPRRHSQWSDEPLEFRNKPKIKTRGVPDPIRQPDGPETPQDEHQPRQRFIFTNATHYEAWREIFPLPGDRRTGKLTFPAFCEVMMAPPLLFEEVYIDMPECKWRRQGVADGEPKVFTLHRDHDGGFGDPRLLMKLRGRFKKNFGWEAENFVLKEK